MEVWIYLWKAGGANTDKENPSDYDYKLVNVENYFGLEKYNESDGDSIWKYYAEDWADRVSTNGYYRGYSYGWEEKTPPKEWIEKKIGYEKDKIKSIKSNIKSLKEYL